MALPRNDRRSRAPWLALALVVLLAEVFAFAHPLDADAHGGTEPCKICLSIGGHSAVNVADAPIFGLLGRSPRPTADSTRLLASAHRIVERARAPPSFS